MIVMRVPSRYMRDSATSEEKEVFAFYKQKLLELCESSGPGLIMPSDRDPETRQYIFDIEVV
jgi:hypothetical protein